MARDAAIMQLYGDLPPAAQDAVLAPSSTRKIVLSTNVAETSVTIPGVTAVIDSGTARVMQIDPRDGLPKLQLQSISQAAADQRAGRAGRTEPGICHRLWPAAIHRSRRASDLPEICRCDFSGSLLTLASWGERDVFAFPWLTPPPHDAVVAARNLLQRLDAIDGHDHLTELGSQMLELPLSPRLARFMIEASQHNVVHEAAIAAALLSERDPFRGVAVDTHCSESGCDVTDRVERLQQAFREKSSSAVNPHAIRQIERAARQIEREVVARRNESLSSSVAQVTADDSLADRLKRSLLAAFPDRLARRRAADSDRGVLVGGRGVRLDRRSLARNAELFLCIEIDSQGIEATVTVASEIKSAWLDRRHVREVDEPLFDASLSAVVARRRRYVHDLLLSESPIRCHSGPAVAKLLAAEARKDLARVLPKKDDRLQEFIQQVRFLSRNLPQLEIPPLDSAAIDDTLDQLCQSRTSFAELSSAPWLDHLRGRYDYQQLKLIEQHAPSRITVPSGNAITVRYDESKPPMMEVRIQEIFGWRETPRVAGGRVSVQLHLLGPNYRPQQITDDLASFWNETYSQVRKELRRRYPKHHWPEDPRTAIASRNGLKPRSPDTSA
jgi:ATP-dependent helicase HrpB